MLGKIVILKNISYGSLPINGLDGFQDGVWCTAVAYSVKASELNATGKRKTYMKAMKNEMSIRQARKVVWCLRFCSLRRVTNAQPTD